MTAIIQGKWLKNFRDLKLWFNYLFAYAYVEVATFGLQRTELVT